MSVAIVREARALD
ncbi:MAG: hypothetical protein J4N29_00970 [Chloroflexi bacterium]|nr:hypothetical protein [Chloroflexota bacterium]MCI0815601.1 hypothetical protein [Chloroflexota bacterium]MCI0888046.1 hypothetical protein [Chloroflexota bacterium]